MSEPSWGNHVGPAGGITRRRLIRSLALLPLLRLFPANAAASVPESPSGRSTRPEHLDIGEGPIRIALIADCQFADVDSTPTAVRQYLHSPQKLADAVETLAKEKPHFAVHLGDLIDRDFRSFGVVKPIYDRFACPRFHVAGNHDYSVSDDRKALVRPLLGIPESGAYEITVPGWRFLFLDSNEVSIFRHPKGTPGHEAAVAEQVRLRKTTTHASFAQDYNGGLGPVQREWLRGRLTHATAQKEKVIIFCHQPALPSGTHSLWDAPETLGILAEFPCAVAWINGHNHDGSYHKIGGTHHLNLKGMVDTRDNTFALATIHPDRIEIRGYGREPSRVLNF
jgi:predicted phosphodiesterase